MLTGVWVTCRNWVKPAWWARCATAAGPAWAPSAVPPSRCPVTHAAIWARERTYSFRRMFLRICLAVRGAMDEADTPATAVCGYQRCRAGKITLSHGGRPMWYAIAVPSPVRLSACCVRP